MRRLLLSLALVLPLMSGAYAQENATAPDVTALGNNALGGTALGGGGKEPPMPKPLVEQRVRGAQVYYLGKYEGLNGWMMLRAGQPEFYYATPDNKAMVMGFLFDQNGDLLTSTQMEVLQRTQSAGLVDMMASQLGSGDQQAQAETAVPAAPAATPVVPAPVQQQPAPAAQTPTAAVQPVPAAPIQQQPGQQQPAPAASTLGDVANTIGRATPADRLFNDVKNAPAQLWGKAGTPTFYALIDPNCPHCKAFMRDVEASVTAGRVAVQIIPVGFDDESKRQAAFMLASGDGVSRLLRHAKDEAGTLPAPKDINIEAIEINNKIITGWNLMATPIIVYRDGRKSEVRLIRGRPTDLNAAIADLRGE